MNWTASIPACKEVECRRIKSQAAVHAVQAYSPVLSCRSAYCAAAICSVIILHPFLGFGHPFLTVRAVHDHFFKMLERPRILELSHEARPGRLDLCKDHDVLADRVVEHIGVDRAVIDKRRGHVPIRRDHSQITADSGSIIVCKILVDARRVKAEDPVSGLASFCLAAQVVKFQDQIRRFYFTHIK